VSNPAKKPFTEPLIKTVLVVAGSLAIFFPAWLPETPVLPTEDGMVESLQLILLFTVSAFWFGGAKAAGSIAPFYKIMGTITFAAALGEGDSLIEKTIKFPVEFIYIPLGIFALLQFTSHKNHFGEFLNEFTSHATAGFYASSLILIIVLAQFLGGPLLWKASLGENYHSDVPKTVKAYLELLACYLLLVGTIGLCLAPKAHDPTALD